MSDTTVIASRSDHNGSAVRAPLSFIDKQCVDPIYLSAAYTGGAPKYLFAVEQHTISIQDMRPHANEISLDRQGFRLLPHNPALEDFYDDDLIESVYFPDVKNLLLSVLAADRVVIFDATRRSDGATGAVNREGMRGPARLTHVDYTGESGPRRALNILGQTEWNRLAASGARIVQINVWRSIRGTVRRCPLALADASSIEPVDLVPTIQVFPDRVGEIYHLVHNPLQRWCYAPDMRCDEVLLIKGWDSLEDGRARFTPHAAFDLPTAPENAPPRESIELRALVIFENRAPHLRI